LKRGYEAGDLQNTEWKCIMVRAVHMVVGMSLCLDQDFLIPSKCIIVIWVNSVRMSVMSSEPTDLK
jgi:hypothetical protein